MKKEYVLFGILMVCVSLFALSNTIVGKQKNMVLLQSESTSVSGNISENTTWTLASSPYIVIEDVIVDNGVCLTIEPGVVVKFTARTNLVIDGGLIAQGNATHKITFTSNATAPAPGDWTGIVINGPSEDFPTGHYFIITHSIIEYAATGIRFEHDDGGGPTGVLEHSQITSNGNGIILRGVMKGRFVSMNGLTIERNTGYGIYVRGVDLYIENSLMSNNRFGVKAIGYAPWWAWSLVDITNSTISNNTLDGVYIDTGRLRIQNSDIVNNGRRGIRSDSVLGGGVRCGWTICVNSRISSNLGDGIFAGSNEPMRMHNCEITNNGGHGISSDGDTPVSILGSIISNNSGNGVLAQRNVNIKSTTIIDNGDVGVSSKWGNIHFSNVYNNGWYEVESTGGNINATHNWWGTTNETVIGEHIYDYYDNTSSGVVSYVPFLNSSTATLTIFTNGVSSDEPVYVKKDGTEVSLVHDEKPLNITVYSGHTQPNIGTFSLSIDNIRIWDSNPNARYNFVNWTGIAESGISDTITITVTADSSITAFYKTQYLTSFTFKDSSGTDTLPIEPSEIQLIAPNGSPIMLTSFLNQWLDEGTWTIKQIQWQGNNVKPSTDPIYTPTPGGTWAISCRVYLISFIDSFKDSDGNDLYTLPSSFKLTFPNGTTSAPLNPTLSYYIQNGSTTWSSIIWQGTEVYTSNVNFDPTNGNPTVNCKVYSITVDPIFYDNVGIALVQPSSWSIKFPNGTISEVSSTVTYNQTQTGEYSIVSIIWQGAEVIPDITPTASLTSNKLWSPSINCLLPTSLYISLSSSTSYVGFKVEINGNLTCNEVGLSGAPIHLSYSVTSGESWNDITLVNTASDGSYSAVWMLPATGNYLVRTTWSGNSTYPGTTTIINLAVILFEEQNVFSVTSNSTVSELAFNSTSRELSFTVTGPSDTTGYINVHIAKTLIDNIADVTVYLDGNQINYTATSLDDSWRLHFTYQHSTHKVTISLGHISAPFIETPLGQMLIYGVSITAIIILITFYISKKKHMKT